MSSPELTTMAQTIIQHYLNQSGGDRLVIDHWLQETYPHLSPAKKSKAIRLLKNYLKQKFPHKTITYNFLTLLNRYPKYQLSVYLMDKGIL